MNDRAAKTTVAFLAGVSVMVLLCWTMLISEAQVTTGPNRSGSSSSTNVTFNFDTNQFNTNATGLHIKSASKQTNDLFYSDFSDVFLAIDVLNRTLHNEAGSVVANWNDGVLYASGTESIIWGNRTFIGTDEAVAMNYGNRTTSGAWAFTGSSGAFSNSIATFSTTATNAIAATGITNTSAFNRHAVVTATAISFSVKNFNGTNIYISPVLTATVTIPLQPGGALTAASGLSGTLLPY